MHWGSMIMVTSEFSEFWRDLQREYRREIAAGKAAGYTRGAGCMLAPFMKDTKLSPALTGGGFSFRGGVHQSPATHAYGNVPVVVEKPAAVPPVRQRQTRRCPT